jgi:outer membrane protein OmpA-like peptidoglycan-associated protein
MKSGVRQADRDGVIRLKIYAATRGPVHWEPRGEMPFCSDEYSCVHPSLSADGRLLYFASDMPGGFGGMDLYLVERQTDGSWSTPQNLGAAVNTDKNEVFPFIHPSGTLFFSSNGHNTIGGLDIFFIETDTEGATTVVNLDKPYNSPEDDLGFILDDEIKRGFFASNRNAGPDGRGGSMGRDDVFSFSIEGIEGLAPSTQKCRVIVGDGRTGQKIQGAEIRILKSTRDGFVDNDQGVYDLDFQPVAGEENLMTLQLRPKSSDKMRRPDAYTNAIGETEFDLLRYRSYMLMVSYPGYQTVQQFVTEDDVKDESTLNITLIDAPICHRATGTVATDQLGTRIANAKVIFTHKVTGKIESARTTLNGEYDICLTQPGDYLVQIERTGFNPENFSLVATTTQANYQETRLRPIKIGAPSETEQPMAGALQDGSTIVLDRITYEPNKATLNQTAIRNLDALHDLMQRYPDSEIEIVCHTDTRPDTRNAQALSVERAQNAQAYLVYRGIAEQRIKVSGKGNTQPRNRCVPGVQCTPDEHQSNQRLEIKVKRSKA